MTVDRKSQSSVRKWYRVKKGSKLCGVCRGLADYTNIPVLAIRVAFVIATLFGGWGAFIYFVLCMCPQREGLEKATSKPIFLAQFASNFLAFLTFIFLCAGVYFPAFIVLIAITVFFLGGWVYPLVEVGIHKCTFAKLGVFGGSLSIFGCVCAVLTMYFIVHWISQVHLKKRYKPLSLIIISIFTSGMILFSSIFVLQQYKDNSQQKVWVFKQKVAEDWEITNSILFTDAIPIVNFYCSTHDRDEIEITYLLTIHGWKTDQMIDVLDSLKMNWGNGVPNWVQLEQIRSYFPSFDVKMKVPHGKNLHFLAANSADNIYISGDWKDVSLNNSDTFINKSTIDTLNIQAKHNRLVVRNSKIKTGYFYIIDSSFSQKNTQYENVQKLHSEKSSVFFVSLLGKTEVSGISSDFIFLKPVLGDASVFDLERGFFSIYFAENEIPNLTVYNEEKEEKYFTAKDHSQVTIHLKKTKFSSNRKILSYFSKK